ncbi:MAG: hypothetical protein N2053_12190 [Chitinispirillaceae bacterium]|nr:hypothetical protein [Chitinispirillaceae bacterium]
MDYKLTINRYLNEFNTKREILLKQLSNILNQDVIDIENYYVYDDRVKFYYKSRKRKSTPINDYLNIDEYIEVFEEYIAKVDDEKLKPLYEIYVESKKILDEYRRKRQEYLDLLRNRLKQINDEQFEIVKKLLEKENILTHNPNIGYVSINDDNIQIRIYDKLPVLFGNKESACYITVYNNEVDEEKLKLGEQMFKLEVEKREIRDYLVEEDPDNDE